MPTHHDTTGLTSLFAGIRELEARFTSIPDKLLAGLRKVMPRIDALRAVVEQLQNMERDPRIRAVPEMHAVIIAILSQAHPGDWPIRQVTPENVAKLLGAQALAAQKKTQSEINSKNASESRKAEDAVLAKYDEWGGAAMSAEKRAEFMAEVCREYGVKQWRTVKKWAKKRA
ncbi:hypothetical protein, partial [Paraburkholderia unamae]|uniref:hypothetical protein n=1 Tax=Paraburkholderia unamae TaxID=219649 RepID=UPI003FD846DB